MRVPAVQFCMLSPAASRVAASTMVFWKSPRVTSERVSKTCSPKTMISRPYESALRQTHVLLPPPSCLTCDELAGMAQTGTELTEYGISCWRQKPIDNPDSVSVERKPSGHSTHLCSSVRTSSLMGIPALSRASRTPGRCAPNLSHRKRARPGPVGSGGACGRATSSSPHSSSPATGGLPRPARLRMRFARLTLARPDRSRK